MVAYFEDCVPFLTEIKHASLQEIIEDSVAIEDHGHSTGDSHAGCQWQLSCSPQMLLPTSHQSLIFLQRCLLVHPGASFQLYHWCLQVE